MDSHFVDGMRVLGPGPVDSGYWRRVTPTTQDLQAYLKRAGIKSPLGSKPSKPYESVVTRLKMLAELL